ncbi:MAG: hypothetical protein JRN15_12600 [Nitrososphaerota archaeon]|nr:hypothetical protein [Nitrososphaerota archaeon]
MKDYKRFVLWTDYFNSSLSRYKGRRVPLDRSVKDPTVEELAEAGRRLGFTPEVFSARHPKRTAASSGYVNVPKTGSTKKSQIISDVAKHLSNVRGERTAAVSKEQLKGKKSQSA